MKVPVVAAIVVDNGRVLLIRRAVADDRLLWQFPAGKIESGETSDEAAVREPWRRRVSRSCRWVGSRGE